MANTNKFLDENGVLYFWQKIVNKINGNVVNNLTSNDTDKALSAQQGKVLDEKITAINSNIGNLGGGDMLKSTYDADNDGKVDKAKAADTADTAADTTKFGGQSPDYYAKKTELFSGSYNDLKDKPTDFAPTEHGHDVDEVNGLSDTITSLTAVANGKCAAYVFDTEADLDTAIAEYIAYVTNSTAMSDTNPLKGKTLKTGDVFYIRAVEVPDYWWDESTNTKQILETTKVTLNAISNAEIDSIIASI